MPKLLRAVRLDDSDDRVFRDEGAAKEGEPVVTGGFAGCLSSFLAIGSRARCSIAEVREVTEEELEAEIEAFAWTLVRNWNAPSWEAARELAEEEVRHTAEVCETLAPEVWITVKRAPSADGNAIDEQYAVYDRLMIGAHEIG
jgi:hypothetical protein